MSTRQCASCSRAGSPPGAAARIELGLQHEQQHQELILTDVKHLLSRSPLQPAYQPGRPPAPRRAAPTREMGGVRRRPRRIRPRRSRLRVRQRDASPPSVRRAIRAGVAAGHARRVCGVHRRWRLPAPRTVAGARLGMRAAARLDGTALLAEGRRPVADIHAARNRRCRPADAGRACQLLRSGRFRALGTRAAPDRIRMGARGARRSGGRQLRRVRRAAPAGVACGAARGPAGATLRRRVGMDAQAPTRRTRAIGPPPARWASTTASSCATSTCCAAARARARHRTFARRTAISSRPTRAGSSPACAWPGTTPDTRRQRA